MFFPARPVQRRSIAVLISSALLGSLVPGLSASAQSLPTVASYAAGANNTTLTINGSNFGTTPNTVYIDNASASIVSWSNTSITVELPAQAGPGTISLDTAAGISATVPFRGVERGYFLLSSNGAVTPEGGAQSFGDLTTLASPPSSPAVQLIPTKDGQGYWILTQNGSIYPFGDATSLGSAPSGVTAVGMAVLPQQNGAYVLGSNGSVYALGQAKFYGQPAQTVQAQSIAVTSDGNGYWVLGDDGTVYAYGDAGQFGDPAPKTAASSLPNNSLVKISSSPAVFLLKNGTLYHVPNPEMLDSMGFSFSQVHTVTSLSDYTLGLPLVAPFQDGALVRSQATATTYLMQNNVLHPISDSVQQQLGLTSPPTVVPVLKANWPVGPAATASNPVTPNGNLYCLASGAVYIVDNGVLRHIASASVFLAMGLQWGALQHVASLPNLPVGRPITEPVAVLNNGSLWRQSHTNPVYLDQNGRLRHIPSLSLFQKLGFSMSQVKNVPSLSGLATAKPLGSTNIPSSTASPAPTTTSSQAVSMVPTRDNKGYWVLMQNGSLFAYGNATLYGQPSPVELGTNTAVSLAVTPDQSGYTVLLSDGQALSFGDALPASMQPGSLDLAMTPGAPTNLGFLSMAYGDFLPHNDGSYVNLTSNGPDLSTIMPTWYYPSQDPLTLDWNIGSPPSQAASVVTQAHSEGVRVWPMFGSVSVGPFQNAANITRTVNEIAAAVQNNNYDGVTIDFEPSSTNGLSLAQVETQYTRFVTQLGARLHQLGKQLMVCVYPFTYPQSPFNFKAIASAVDYINIMSYGEFDSYTEAGPNQGLGWDAYIFQSALNDGVPASKLVMGLGPYGDYWSFNNFGLDSHAPLGNDSFVSDRQVAQLLASHPGIKPVFDPAYGTEVFMTNYYLGTNGQWTANSTGSAKAPTLVLSTADNTKRMNQVVNLQGLLNYILMRYAVDNNQQVPTYLNLAQDGLYGSTTARAVTQFQKDFNVSGAKPGVYDAATQTALKQVIQSWHIGEYQYWVGNTQSLMNRVSQVAIPDHLGGAAIWRTPFESPDYWPNLADTINISPHGH